MVLNNPQSHRWIPTSSCGRILDAAAALLDLCYYRSYDGEPAMRLEAAARGGKWVPFNDPTSLEDSNTEIISTHILLEDLWQQIQAKQYHKRDLAFSFQVALAQNIASKAAIIAQDNQIDYVGLSGGVAYNDIIVRAMRQVIEHAGLSWVQHYLVPPGDGGLAFGQALLGGADWNTAFIQK